MDGTCVCGRPLRESIYSTAIDSAAASKSCPQCSATAGRHVFYQIEHFGQRDMGDGRVEIQSWCPACRAGVGPSNQPHYICND